MKPTNLTYSIPATEFFEFLEAKYPDLITKDYVVDQLYFSKDSLNIIKSFNTIQINLVSKEQDDQRKAQAAKYSQMAPSMNGCVAS